MANTSSPDILSQISDRIPPERLSTYSRLWQLETWLRTLVYVELRARYADTWQSHLKNTSPRAQEKDDELTHMPTRESLPISYMQLRDLLATISSHWRLFQPYLPPKPIWTAKLSEISQIRHRIAHFRLGHKHDAHRVEQLLRDIDQGIWEFCTSYNSSMAVLPQSNDLVIRNFLHLDPFPWSEVEPNKWVRIGSAPPDLVISATFEVMRRPWLKSRAPKQVSGKYGYLYDVTLAARNSRRFDYSLFLNNTKSVHQRLCHICLANFSDIIRFTIPTSLGREDIIDIIQTLIEAAQYSVRPGRDSFVFEKPSETGSRQLNMVDTFAEKWPEYVLGPSNPLTFLGPDMPCSFFGIE